MNNVCAHGTLQTNDTFRNSQATGRSEGRSLKLFKNIHWKTGSRFIQAQECSKHETFLAFSFFQTSVRAYNFIFCMIFFDVSVKTSPLVLKQI